MESRWYPLLIHHPYLDLQQEMVDILLCLQFCLFLLFTLFGIPLIIIYSVHLFIFWLLDRLLSCIKQEYPILYTSILVKYKGYRYKNKDTNIYI